MAVKRGWEMGEVIPIERTRENDEWETPDDLFATLDHEFQFDVDVCAGAHNAKLAHYFTPEQDGLKQEWGRLTCWCNPPYSCILPWIMKAARAAVDGATVVMLLPADTSTQWFSFVFDEADEIRLLTGRVRFKHAPGAPKFGSVVAVFNGRYRARSGGVRVTKWNWREAVAFHHKEEQEEAA
jgi:phage N-6-adenine-methyltransferase